MTQSDLMKRSAFSLSVETSATDAADDPVIEGLRGLAALLVMATHYAYMLTTEAGIWRFASTGVDLFFVLSGYVFAPYLCGKSLNWAPHLIRRFFRLYPLFLCALLVYATLRLPAATAWDHFFTHVIMAHTLSALEIANYYNAAFWSLPPEIEYYLLLPWLVLLIKPGRMIWLVTVALAMHLLLVAAAVPDEGVTPRAIATIHLPGMLIEFALGSMAYVLLKENSDNRARMSRLALGLLVLGGTAALFATYIIPDGSEIKSPPVWISGNIGLGAALGYALIVSAVAAWPLPSLRLTWSFAILGQLSYGVYLFHNASPQILGRLQMVTSGWTGVLSCVLLTLAIAAIGHHAVERPLRKYGRRLSQAF